MPASFLKFAATEQLIVEPSLADYLRASFLQAALPPVPGPCGNPFYLRAGPQESLIDLRQIFPSGRRQRSGKGVVPIRSSIPRRPQQAEFEALKAALSPFGLTAQPLRTAALETLVPLHPQMVVIVVVDELQGILAGIALDFVAAYGIFGEWSNVGVAEEYCGSYAAVQQALDYGTRTGSTAGVQQQTPTVAGQLDYR